MILQPVPDIERARRKRAFQCPDHGFDLLPGFEVTAGRLWRCGAPGCDYERLK